MLLRRERPDDIPAIREVHRQAFSALGIYDGEPVEHALIDALRADEGWVPPLSIVVEGADGAVIGHVVGTEGRLGDVAVIGVGPIGVLPAHQGAGAGSALMHALLAATDALGYPMAILLGRPAYYERFGFVPAASIGVVPPDPQWTTAFQARTLGTYAGEAGAFRYAAPFEAL